jgi:methylated-DNA-[protein]-cysteine S-methyltransferase
MSEYETFFSDKMNTPLGTAILIADQNGGLRMLFWEEQADTWRKVFHRRHGAAAVIPRRDPFGHIAALKRYFDGEITALDGISVSFRGTPFQKKVWSALRTIEGGTTLSYGALARRIHVPKAVRAVGVANGSNPVGVVVPCHRVIGSDGSLTGYGGGLPRKRWLLEHEARHSPWRLEMSA